MSSASKPSLSVLVTGATGFIGQAVVAELLRCGFRVRAMVRRTEQQHSLPSSSALECVVADVTELDGLVDVMQGIDVVIHLAGVVWGAATQMHGVMVDGTANVIESMRQANVARLVLASSFLVYDWQRIDGVLTESSPLAHEKSNRQGAYSAAKVGQELMARKLCKTHDIQLVVLRPAAVVAPKQLNAADLGPRLGPLQVVIAPFRKLRLVKLEHAVSAFVKACAANIPDGQAINLLDDRPLTAWQFACSARRDSHGFSVLVPLPYWVVIGAARLIYPVFTLMRLSRFLPGLLIPERVESRFKSVECDVQAWHRYLP